MYCQAVEVLVRCTVLHIYTLSTLYTAQFLLHNIIKKKDRIVSTSQLIQFYRLYSPRSYRSLLIISCSKIYHTRQLRWLHLSNLSWWMHSKSSTRSLSSTEARFSLWNSVFFLVLRPEWIEKKPHHNIHDVTTWFYFRNVFLLTPCFSRRR